MATAYPEVVDDVGEQVDRLRLRCVRTEGDLRAASRRAQWQSGRN